MLVSVGVWTAVGPKTSEKSNSTFSDGTTSGGPPRQNYLPSKELGALSSSTCNRGYIRGNHLLGPRFQQFRVVTPKNSRPIPGIGSFGQPIPRLTRIMPCEAAG
jgi:hypothetical protein